LPLTIRARPPGDFILNCSSCQRDNPSDAAFCAGCGRKLARVCITCRRENQPDASFCNGCGESLADPGSRRAPAERSPADYTPKHLADKILQSKSALEGERKQVTVMFADVKGSMELAEQLDPEEWHRILERFFEILTEGVHRFEGTVNQYTGDGIMALFGAPIAHEDHAQRACYAALHLQGELARYATEVKRAHGVGFSTRIGIHSGDVVVGRIGDDLRMDYTAQGHTVGLAQRMESLASPDACYLTAATAALAGGYFALEDLGDFRVKGVADEVRVHRLTGIGEARNRFDISRARGLARFVGRAADLRTLDDALDQASAGSGQVVGVVAEAGTGKSRLCFEFLERCRARGLQVYECRAVAHGRNIPLLPILELFRDFFGIGHDDDDKRAREKIAGRMVVLDRAFADALPLVYEFLGVGDPQRPAPKLDPEVRQRQLMGLMRQVTKDASETTPTVILVEDLHWLDEASAEFLEHMVDVRADTRSLLLLNFRPEYRADWMQKSWYRQIPLTPLGRDAIAELLTDLLGSHPSIAALATPIHARTAGNPFFTEEVAQTLIESGNLEGTRGDYRLVTPIEKLEVPATVQAVLAARIDRLPEREKRLLQVASVIGKDFPEPLLAKVAELTSEDLKASLAALRQAEFIHELAIYPVVEYAFKHPLTQEVALGSQLRERRREVHATVARAIEAQYAEHLDERAPLLAHHYEEAGEALPAARWHRRAAEWVASTDLTASTRHWQRVRALLAGSDDREAADLVVAACKELLNMGWRVGLGLDDAEVLLAEGQALAKGMSDRRMELDLAIVFTRTHCSAGDVATYLELAIQNELAAREIDDVGLQAGAVAWLVDALGVAARFPDALRIADEGRARFPRFIDSAEWVTPFNPFTMISFWRAYSLVWLGDLPKATDARAEFVTLNQDDGSREFHGYGHIFRAEALYLAADPGPALACARQLEEVSRELGDFPSMVAYSQMTFAFAHLAAERASDAIEAARNALELCSRVERHWQGRAAGLLAEALLLAGDDSAAQAAAEDAIALCRRSERGQYEAMAHSVLARALLRRDGVAAREAAEAAISQAAALIESTGASTLAPSLCEWRAELAAVIGEDIASQQLLSEAERGYRQIGAPLQAERIAHELASRRSRASE
jgi:class 3 adenylate cyclase